MKILTTTALAIGLAIAAPAGAAMAADHAPSKPEKSASKPINYGSDRSAQAHEDAAVKKAAAQAHVQEVHDRNDARKADKVAEPAPPVVTPAPTPAPAPDDDSDSYPAPAPVIPSSPESAPEEAPVESPAPVPAPEPAPVVVDSASEVTPEATPEDIAVVEDFQLDVRDAISTN